MNNNFKIIAKFNYDDKNFIITMVNDKHIVYSFYDENNRLHMTLPDKYYEICNFDTMVVPSNAPLFAFFFKSSNTVTVDSKNVILLLQLSLIIFPPTT